MFDIDTKNINVSYRKLNNSNSLNRFYVSHTFKICTVLEGSAIWEIGGIEFEINKNDVILLNNRDKRLFKKINEESDLNLLIVEFEPQLLFSTGFLPLFINRIKNLNPVLPFNVTSEIILLFKKIEAEFANKEIDCNIMISSCLIKILVHIRRYFRSKGYNFEVYKLDSKIYKALDYINENYDKDINLKDVADIMFMSTSAFSKYFLKCNGIGFNQYVIRKRVEKAIYLLESTDETVLSVAMECGFNSGASFYQAFNKVVGVNPKSYR